MRILIADDDRLFAEYLTALVVDCGHEVVATVTGGGLATLQSYARHRPDVALLDVIMPRYNGFTVCQQLVSRDPAARVILMSGLVAADYPSLASSPACGYLSKPFVMAELHAALAQADFSRKLWLMGPDPILSSPVFTKAQEATEAA
jgi:two-component system response regulator MprA